MRNFDLYDMFSRNASLFPVRTALVQGKMRISFADLLQRTNACALQLYEMGIRKGDRVAFLANNQAVFFELVGAVAALGAVIVPLNRRLAHEELGFILRDCTPAVLFTDAAHFETGKEICEKGFFPQEKVFLLADFLSPQASEPNAIDHLRPGNLSAESAYCIIYTAAVEGKPRGAVLSQANLVAANMQVITTLGLTDQDAVLDMLPLFHITGLNLALAVMQVGGKNVILETFSEIDTVTLTEAEAVTVWGSFPPILQRVSSVVKEDDVALDTLRHIVGLDGPETVAAFEGMTNAVFWILYGQSETSGFVTLSPALEQPGTAGKQGPLSVFQLVDEEEQLVSLGETGEIVVRGPLVFQGYWQQEELNAYTFRNGWHHTGDLGQMDPDGYLVFKGRKPEKELIKPGGENVYPAEVEAVIMQHPAIQAVSVIGVPDPQFGEGIKAVCELQPGAQLEGSVLTEFVASRIARYKKPKYIEFVDALPRLEDGAVNRDKVKEFFGT